MSTTFYKEGKVLSYTELTHMLGHMIEKKVINELDESALQSFYIRLFEATYTKIKEYLEAKNYKVVNYRQGLITATQVKLIGEPEIWYEALEKKNLITEGKEIEDLPHFITNVYYNQMKKLLHLLDEK